MEKRVKKKEESDNNFSRSCACKHIEGGAVGPKIILIGLFRGDFLVAFHKN